MPIIDPKLPQASSSPSSDVQATSAPVSFGDKHPLDAEWLLDKEVEVSKDAFTRILYKITVFEDAQKEVEAMFQQLAT